MILELAGRGIIKSMRREQATGSTAQAKDWVLIRVKTCHPLKQAGRQSVSTDADRWVMRVFPPIASISSVLSVRQGHKLEVWGVMEV